MATRSYILVQNSDQTISGVYCHFDGYINGVGKVLLEHYNDEEKAKKLISKGGFEALQEDFNKIQHYPDSPILHFKDKTQLLEEAKQNLSIEYFYLFSDGDWLVLDTYEYKRGKVRYKDFVFLETALNF